MSRFLKHVEPDLLEFQIGLLSELIFHAVNEEKEARSEVSDGLERLVAKTRADTFRTAAGILMMLARDTQFDLRTEAEARVGMTLTGVVAAETKPKRRGRSCR